MPARKRQRDNVSEEDDESSKRHRGRPRVNEQDETAADRRRTQIRLAQRAYRQRKENTIASLQDQVSRLQSTIEDMNKAFLTLNGKLVGSNLLRMDPGLARDLRDATQQFVTLARGSGSDGAESEYSDTPAPSSKEKVSIANILSPVPSRKVLDIGLGYVKVLDGASPETEPPQTETTTVTYQDHAYGDQSFNGQIPLPGISPVQALQPTKPPSPDFSLYSRLTEQLPTSGFGARLPTPPPAPLYNDQYSYLKSTSLQASYTFSVEEKTFTRRLHRAALERAFHLLATASQRQGDFDRVFRLSLLWNSRADLMAKCQSILTKGIDDPLELSATPFISIGGAGQHYSDRPPRNSYVVKPGRVGHARLVNQETGFDAGIDWHIDLTEYDGDWFDLHDVNGYLESLDLHIDARSTFTEATMITGGPLHSLLVSGGLLSPEGPRALSSGDSSINSSPRLAHIPSGTLQDGATRLFPELGLNGSEGTVQAHAAADWLMGASERTPDFLSPTEGWSGVQPGPWTPSHPLTPPGSSDLKPSVQTRNVTIDVGNIIDYIISRGICLGRTPGFKRLDVEKAIVVSVMEIV